MSERRIAQRSRTFWKGTIIFPGGLRSVECTVRNYSETNATYACEVAWRRGGEIGARFVTGAAEAGVEAINEKLKELAAQNKRLQRQINDRDSETL